MYPLISEYIEAIKAAEDNFDQLKHLRPVIGDDGLPVMTSGNFAVVFKMKDEQNGKFYAIKCFTKEQEGRTEAYKQITEELAKVDSPYILSVSYLDKELFVDTEQTAETEFPVLLMDWVEGKTLDKYLRENLDDKYALEMLAYRFSQLAQWLIPQPFAHGDLKPDNILVREDGTLVLVDYDGMYVPAMKGQKARELGSPDFRHPLRTENDFNEHIDDFPLVSILLSLKSISHNPQWLVEYGAADRLLFSNNDYQNIGNCNCLKTFLPIACNEIKKLISLMILLCCDCIIKPNYIHLLKINIPISLIPIIRETYNDEPCKFSLYDVYNKKYMSELFDYVSFIDPSLEISNSCIISKDLAPIEDLPILRPTWPWTGSMLNNAAIVSCINDINNPVWYESIKSVRTNNKLFIAVNYQQKYGLIDDKNNVVVNFCYNYLEAIEDGNGFFLAKNIDELSGIIDDKGNTIIDFQYNIKEEIKGGYFLCKKDNMTLLLSPNGEEITIDYNGTMIHFGTIAVGISSPKEVIRFNSTGRKISMNEYIIHVYREGKFDTAFTVLFEKSWRNVFYMTVENQITVEHFPCNLQSTNLIPDSYIDLEGNIHVAPRDVSGKSEAIHHSPMADDIPQNNNTWLSNYVKEKYLKGVHLPPHNDDNTPTSYEIKIIGNIALVSYSYYSLMYPDDCGQGYLGYADENMYYW